MDFLTKNRKITKILHNGDSNPDLPLQNHVGPHCARGTIAMEILKDASEVRKMSHMAEIRNRFYHFRIMFYKPHSCHFFENIRFCPGGHEKSSAKNIFGGVTKTNQKLLIEKELKAIK